MRREKIRLGDLLIDEGLISEEQLKEAVKIQKESNFTKKLGEILIDEGFVAGKDLLKVLSKQLGIEFIDIYGEKIDFDALLKYPLKLLRNANAIPFKEDEDYVYRCDLKPILGGEYDKYPIIEKKEK